MSGKEAKQGRVEYMSIFFFFCLVERLFRVLFFSGNSEQASKLISWGGEGKYIALISISYQFNLKGKAT